MLFCGRGFGRWGAERADALGAKSGDAVARVAQASTGGRGARSGRGRRRARARAAARRRTGGSALARRGVIAVGTAIIIASSSMYTVLLDDQRPVAPQEPQGREKGDDRTSARR